MMKSSLALLIVMFSINHHSNYDCIEASIIPKQIDWLAKRKLVCSLVNDGVWWNLDELQWPDGTINKVQFLGGNVEESPLFKVVTPQD